MEENIKFGSPQEEIDALERRMAELKAIHGEGKEHGEIVKDAVKEHLQKNPEQVLDSEHRLSAEEIKEQASVLSRLKLPKIGSTKSDDDDDSDEEDSHQRQIGELIKIAVDKGPINAVSIVKELDPHLEDKFHDAFVTYFQKLKGNK